MSSGSMLMDTGKMDRKNRTGKTHTLLQRLRMPLAAAAVTAAVLWGAMYLGDFVPFGSNTPAVTDAKLQYLDLFAYCRDVLTGQNTAAYTFSNTLGGSAAAIWAYYLASPFNLLVLLFPKETQRCVRFFCMVCGRAVQRPYPGEHCAHFVRQLRADAIYAGSGEQCDVA